MVDATKDEDMEMDTIGQTFLARVRKNSGSFVVVVKTLGSVHWLIREGDPVSLSGPSLSLSLSQGRRPGESFSLALVVWFHQGGGIG